MVPPPLPEVLSCAGFVVPGVQGQSSASCSGGMPSRSIRDEHIPERTQQITGCHVLITKQCLKTAKTTPRSPLPTTPLLTSNHQ